MAFADLVGNAHLAVGGQLQGQIDDGDLDLRVDAVLQQLSSGRRREISCNAASPPLSYSSLKR